MSFFDNNKETNIVFYKVQQNKTSLINSGNKNVCLTLLWMKKILETLFFNENNMKYILVVEYKDNKLNDIVTKSFIITKNI